MVGLLAGNLLNRLLQNDPGYKFTSSDRLEILLIFFLIILGIGGEEFLQSYARRINKISVGTTTEISFSENRPKTSRTAAEQPGNAFRGTANLPADKGGGSTGLQRLGKMTPDIDRDRLYVAILAAFEPDPKSAALDDELRDVRQLATVITPIGRCLGSVLELTGDKPFVDKTLMELEPAVRQLATSPRMATPNIVKDLMTTVGSIATYAQDTNASMAAKLRKLTAKFGQEPRLSKEEETFNEQCKPFVLTFDKTQADIQMIFSRNEFFDSIARGRDPLPYATMAYAGLMAALEQYESAAIIMSNWLEGHRSATTVAERWYVARARFALGFFVEEWIRTRGAAASTGLRQYHIENLKEIVDGMQSFAAIWALKNENHDYNVNLLSGSLASDDGLCKLPTARDPQRQITPAEKRDLLNLYESYLSARSSYVDHALKHPIMKRRSAAVIQSHMEDLMTLDLKCIAVSSRTGTRAEHLERYARNEINLLENTAPLKSSDEIKSRIRRAQQLIGLGLQLIEPEVTQARDSRAKAKTVQGRIAGDPTLELQETLLATQDQLQDFSEREVAP